MDVVQTVSGYITKMVTAGDSPEIPSTKMKILLLDNETVDSLNENGVKDC